MKTMKTMKTKKTKKNKFRNNGRKKPRNHSKNRKTYKKYKTHTLKGSGIRNKSGTNNKGSILEQTGLKNSPLFTAIAKADDAITEKFNNFGATLRRNFNRFVPDVKELYSNPHHKRNGVTETNTNPEETNINPEETNTGNSNKYQMKRSKFSFKKIIENKDVKIINYKLIFAEKFKINRTYQFNDTKDYSEYENVAESISKNPGDDVSLENIIKILEYNPDHFVFYYNNSLILLTYEILLAYLDDFSNYYYGCMKNYDEDMIDKSEGIRKVKFNMDVEKEQQYLMNIIRKGNIPYVYIDLSTESDEFKFLIRLDELQSIPRHRKLNYFFEIKETNSELDDEFIIRVDNISDHNFVCEENKYIPRKIYNLLYINIDE